MKYIFLFTRINKKMETKNRNLALMQMRSFEDMASLEKYFSNYFKSFWTKNSIFQNL